MMKSLFLMTFYMALLYDIVYVKTLIIVENDKIVEYIAINKIYRQNFLKKIFALFLNANIHIIRD